MNKTQELFMDWNTLSLDQMVNYLEQKYQLSSSGDAKCIHHLIEFYKENRNNNTTIITKKSKGKPLTQDELDSNFMILLKRIENIETQLKPDWNK